MMVHIRQKKLKLRMINQLINSSGIYLPIIFCLVFFSSCDVVSNHSIIKKATSISNDSEVACMIGYIDTLFNDSNSVSLSEIKGNMTASVYRLSKSKDDIGWLFDSLLNKEPCCFHNVPSCVYSAFDGILFDCIVFRKQKTDVCINLSERNIGLNNFRLIYNLKDNDSLIFESYKKVGCKVFYKEESIKGYNWIYKIRDKWFLACYNK